MSVNVNGAPDPLGSFRAKQQDLTAKMVEQTSAVRAFEEARSALAAAREEVERLLSDPESSDADVMVAKAAWDAVRREAGRLENLTQSLEAEVNNLRVETDSARRAFLNG